MDEYTSKRIFSNRIIFVLVLLTIIITVILANLFNLQIANHKYYETLAEGNRFKLTPIPPPRGLIYDRHQRPIAINKTVYNLELNPKIVDNLSDTLEIIKKSITIDPNNIKKIELAYKNSLGVRNIILRSRLTENEVARLAVDMHHIKGVEINGHILRYYPDQELFSHLIGHVGLLSEEDISKINRYNYAGQQYIGKTGIEKTYEKHLHGKLGFNKIEVNAQNYLVRTVDKYKPQPGSNLLLTVDRDLQIAAHKALGKYSGAVVALDVNNGDILALVSRPTFDANLFVYSFSENVYRKLQSNSMKPFFNRAVSGQYPPGSTIKPFIALAALENHTLPSNHKMYAGPYYQIPGNQQKYRDWKKNGHGWVDLSDSITQSCDVFFYDIAYKMGIKKMASFIKRFGLGEKTGIDTLFEAIGIVPDPIWKQEKLNQYWLPGETIISGIGQGYMLATPLQMAVATSIIATRGKHIIPRIVKAIHNGEKWVYYPPKWRPRIHINTKNWDYVINAMKRVVHSTNGTAYGISHNSDYSIAGKTGTVQIVSSSNLDTTDIEKNQHLIDHGMFIAFAPIEKPQIAIAVLAEHSGSGAIAATITRKILDAYLSKKQVISSNAH